MFLDCTTPISTVRKILYVYLVYQIDNYMFLKMLRDNSEPELLASMSYDKAKFFLISLLWKMKHSI